MHTVPPLTHGTTRVGPWKVRNFCENRVLECACVQQRSLTSHAIHVTNAARFYSNSIRIGRFRYCTAALEAARNSAPDTSDTQKQQSSYFFISSQ